MCSPLCSGLCNVMFGVLAASIQNITECKFKMALLLRGMHYVCVIWSTDV